MATLTDIITHLANHPELQTFDRAIRDLNKDKHGPWITIADAAAYLSVSDKYIRRLMAENHIIYTRLGARSIRISLPSLERYIANNKNN